MSDWFIFLASCWRHPVDAPASPAAALLHLAEFSCQSTLDEMSQTSRAPRGYLGCPRMGSKGLNTTSLSYYIILSYMIPLLIVFTCFYLNENGETTLKNNGSWVVPARALSRWSRYRFPKINLWQLRIYHHISIYEKNMIHEGKGINKDNIIGIKQHIFPEDYHIYDMSRCSEPYLDTLKTMPVLVPGFYLHGNKQLTFVIDGMDHAELQSCAVAARAFHKLQTSKNRDTRWYYLGLIILLQL